MSLEDRQKTFFETMDVPFDTPETTLRKIIPEIIVKWGFGTHFFEALKRLRPILEEKGMCTIPSTLTGLALFLFERNSFTRKEFAVWISPCFPGLDLLSKEEKPPKKPVPSVSKPRKPRQSKPEESIPRIPAPKKPRQPKPEKPAPEKPAQKAPIPKNPTPKKLPPTVKSAIEDEDAPTERDWKKERTFQNFRRNTNPLTPEERKILQLVADLPSKADKLGALVQYSKKYNSTSSRKLPETVDGWLVRCGIFGECLIEMEQFFSQNSSSSNHLARVFMETIRPELLEASGEGESLAVLQSFTKASL